MANTQATAATLLAADIGGTKSELAIFPLGDTCGTSLLQRRYINADYASAEIIDHFLADCEILPQYAGIAVAGVVADDRAQLTNLPWQLDARLLEGRFGFRRVLLLNDLTAVAGSITRLGPGISWKYRRESPLAAKSAALSHPALAWARGCCWRRTGGCLPGAPKGGIPILPR